MMLHDKKAYVGREIQWSRWEIASIEFLEVKGQNGNFFIYDALLEKGL